MFLQAMAKTDEADRRRYERVEAHGETATLRVPGREAMRVVIANLSRGGVALRTDWWTQTGAEVEVDLPGSGGAVTARAARTSDGLLALAFRQDQAMLRRVDAALEQLAAKGPVSLAA